MSNISQSAADLWVAYNKQFYQRFDMHFTGFVIQGVSGQMTSGELGACVVDLSVIANLMKAESNCAKSSAQ